MLENSHLEQDMDTAISFAKEGEESLRQALEAGVFKLNELIWLVSGAIFQNFAYPAATDLEQDLSVIIEHVGFEISRRTYRDKLLVNNRNTFEDTRYEIAVTSQACHVLDKGSVELERPIHDDRKPQRHWKNTDAFGTFNGQPVRIEVTVLHESLPGVVHLELHDIVKSAATSLGFSLTLRSLLLDESYADRVRAILELLAEAHVESNGRDTEIDGVIFRWNNRAYICDKETSPFKSLVFHDTNEFLGADLLREITYPVSVRKVTPEFIREDYPNPPGVITCADLPDARLRFRSALRFARCLPGNCNSANQE